MVKFILHGGELERFEKLGSDFFDEIFKGNFSSKHNFLIVCFAKELKEWDKSFKTHRARFSDFISNSMADFVLASEKKDIFIEQVKRADVIYFSGGSEILIKKFIRKRDNFINYLENKTIIGKSAGANVFSTYYYSNNRSKIELGLGILPIKTICHYTDDKKDRLYQLIKFGKKMPSIALRSGHFSVIYI